jgi:integrase
VAKALTALAVERAKPGPARREIPDGLLRGLYLIVQPTGAKSWAVRYRYRSAFPRKLTIGPWPAIDLATARDLGAKALRRVAVGDDPASEKHEKRHTSNSVENVISDFIERHAKQRRTGREIERILRREVEPLWKGRRIQDIAKRDVIALVDAIEQRGAPIMANRTFGVVRVLFRWCVDKAILTESPCTDVRPPGTARQRDRMLTDAELRLVWNACDVVKWPYGPQVKLLILTGCRRAEIADLRWSEVDFEGRMLRLPRERVKNDIAHDVPLSAPALAILDRIPRSKTGLVFPSETGLTSASSFARAKRRFDKAITAANNAAIPPWVVHDIRRTVASGMARLGINLPVIEKCLNHTSGSFAGIVGVYQRHSFADEKRTAFDAWGRFVAALVTDAPSANVVGLRREAV